MVSRAWGGRYHSAPSDGQKAAAYERMWPTGNCQRAHGVAEKWPLSSVVIMPCRHYLPNTIGEDGTPSFVRAPQLTDDEVQRIVETTAKRVV